MAFDLELFDAGLYGARRPPIPEEFTLGMKVEVERLRLELLPLQQPYSVSRMTTDTGKVERGAQQTTVDDGSITDCTGISKQGGYFSFQTDGIGVSLETTSQVTARQELMRLPMSRQQ